MPTAEYALPKGHEKTGTNSQSLKYKKLKTDMLGWELLPESPYIIGLYAVTLQMTRKQ